MNRPLLVEAVEEVIQSCCGEPVHRAAIINALLGPGFVLHPDAPCRSALLTLSVYEAVHGGIGKAAIFGAAAVELQMEAAFIFDRVADGELIESDGLTTAEALALAITIMTCGSVAACRAAGLANVGQRPVLPLIQFHSNCVSSCAGQFLDAHLEKLDTASSGDALRMTLLKSGSLGRFAAEFGAALATSDADLINLCGDLGHHAFVYAQLTDDLRDVWPVDFASGDMARHKKTVPVAFFQETMLQSHSSEKPVSFSLSPIETGGALREVFQESAAEAYCAIVAELYLSRAETVLRDLSSRLDEVKGLEQFLESLRHPSAKVLAVR